MFLSEFTLYIYHRTLNPHLQYYQFGLRYLLKGLGPRRLGSSGSGKAADPKNNNNNIIPIHCQMW